MAPAATPNASAAAIAQYTGQCRLTFSSASSAADVMAVAPDVLKALLLHPLTDRGLDQFLRDLSVHHRPRATV